MNSGTSALYLMYLASGLKQDDEILAPAYTYFATVSPLILIGCKPILIDCL